MKNNTNRNVFIYKRTHKGDPCICGFFGVHNCMKSFRDREFTDVIGIGGTSEDQDISKKVNWIGVNAIKLLQKNLPSIITFKKFCLYEDEGLELEKIAPNLYKYMFDEESSHYRRSFHSKNLAQNIQEEIYNILDNAKEHKDLKYFPCKHSYNRLSPPIHSHPSSMFKLIH